MALDASFRYLRPLLKAIVSDDPDPGLPRLRGALHMPADPGRGILFYQALPGNPLISDPGDDDDPEPERDRTLDR